MLAKSAIMCLDLARNKPLLHSVQSRDYHVVRFAGDSGDGIQIQGQHFTNAAGFSAHDLGTHQDFPAEIRAPAGTTFGVSAFQIQFGRDRVHTPGDSPDVLVAFNPAALKVNLALLEPGALVIVDVNAFGERSLKRAGFACNPLQDGSLTGFDVYPIEISQQTLEALRELDLSRRDALRCRNFWVLGFVLWLFDLSRDPVAEWIRKRFAARPEVAEANTRVLHAGHAFGEIAEYSQVIRHETVSETPLAPGEYRTVRGAEAAALGLSAVSLLAGIDLLFCSYPITPASGILHELASMKDSRVGTFQTEDEIASCCAAIGASYAGSLGVTSSSGPGIALKTEALGLAVASELPLLVINSQRAGPSTGLPTKTEQSDLFQAVYGRNGDTPMPVVAAQSPSDCFLAVIDASRIALRHMTPVMLLLDGYMANASELWSIPDIDDTEPIDTQLSAADKLPEQASHEHLFKRDPDTLARPWAVPGRHALMHRVGGLETDMDSGHISYDPVNHQAMTDLRNEKVRRVARFLPDEMLIQGPDEGKLVVLGWGSTYGPLYEAVRTCNKAHSEASGEEPPPVAQCHLRFLHPFAGNLEELLARFERILIAENNTGQLAALMRSQLPRLAARIRQFNKVTGLPFKIRELTQRIDEVLSDE